MSFNDYENRIPKEIFVVNFIPEGRKNRLKAYIISTAAKTKHICDQAWRAHMCNRDTRNRVYCKKNGFDPDVEDYDYSMRDIPRHWTYGIDLPYIINLLQLLCIQGVWDIGLYCKEQKNALTYVMSF